MIILDNNYRIEADPYQYLLYKEGKIGKNGTPAKLDCTYHPTLAGALKRYYRLLEAERISGGFLSLGEAINAATAILGRLEAITKDLDASPNRNNIPQK